MGYVAPAIIQAWGVDKASLGPVLGAGLFGMLVGSLALSVLTGKIFEYLAAERPILAADRIGRRPVLIGASLFFAIIMLATAHVADIDQLMVMRFIAGLAARLRRYSLMVASICRLS